MGSRINKPSSIIYSINNGKINITVLSGRVIGP